MTSLGKELEMMSDVPVIVLSPALEGAFFLSKTHGVFFKVLRELL